MSEQKPLFIPLKKEFFQHFAAGEKTSEYRRYGPRWNERTCEAGRRVVLSLGYSKRARLAGVITGTCVYAPVFLPPGVNLEAWQKLFPPPSSAPVIEICITLDKGDS